MFRDNELVDVPQELGELQGLRELHLQVHFRELSVLWKQILYLINLNLADCNQTASPSSFPPNEKIRNKQIKKAIQGNRLTVLPPTLGSLDFLSSRSILKLDNNPWVILYYSLFDDMMDALDVV